MRERKLQNIRSSRVEAPTFDPRSFRNSRNGLDLALCRLQRSTICQTDPATKRLENVVEDGVEQLSGRNSVNS